MAEDESRHETLPPLIQAAADKFVALRSRFGTEVSTTDFSTVSVAEGILTAVKDTAVDALIATKGDPRVMDALDLEFGRPTVGDKPGDSKTQGAYRGMLGAVATEVARRLSEPK